MAQLYVQQDSSFRISLQTFVNERAFTKSRRSFTSNAGIRVLKYLAGTRNHGLCFDGNTRDWSVLDGYSDADLGGDPETRRSTSGYAFRLSDGAISWSSRRQPIVALFTMQAEYIAASD